MSLQTFSDGLLSVVDRFSRQLGPIATLIDTIVDRVAPKATAQATCPPPGYCYIACSPTCCANCGGDAKHYKYAYFGPGCTSRCVADCTNFC